MIPRLLLLCERAASVSGELSIAERSDAQRLLTLCEDYAASHPSGAHPPEEYAPSLARELGRLVEYLGRRHARGTVLASLGRATLAHLSRDESAYAAACGDVEQKLSLMGL